MMPYMVPQMVTKRAPASIASGGQGDLCEGGARFELQFWDCKNRVQDS